MPTGYETAQIELFEISSSRYYNARKEKGRVYGLDKIDGGFVYRDSQTKGDAKYYLYVSRSGKYYIGEMPEGLLYTHLEQMKLFKIEVKHTALYYGPMQMESALRMQREQEGPEAA